MPREATDESRHAPPGSPSGEQCEYPKGALSTAKMASMSCLPFTKPSCCSHTRLAASRAGDKVIALASPSLPLSRRREVRRVIHLHHRSPRRDQEISRAPRPARNCSLSLSLSLSLPFFSLSLSLSLVLSLSLSLSLSLLPLSVLPTIDK